MPSGYQGGGNAKKKRSSTMGIFVFWEKCWALFCGREKIFLVKRILPNTKWVLLP